MKLRFYIANGLDNLSLSNGKMAKVENFKIGTREKQNTTLYDMHDCAHLPNGAPRVNAAENRFALQSPYNCVIINLRRTGTAKTRGSKIADRLWAVCCYKQNNTILHKTFTKLAQQHSMVMVVLCGICI